MGLNPVVSTVRKVETGDEEDTRPTPAEVEVTTRHFCLAACWAFASAAISSSCSGTGVKGWGGRVITDQKLNNLPENVQGGIA